MLNNKNNCIKLAIKQSCIDVFAHFSHLPYAILLDSANSNHINSRFDIVAIEPQSTLEVKNNKSFLNNIESSDNCFEIMNNELSHLDKTKAGYDLPFNGGWLGYFALGNNRVASLECCALGYGIKNDISGCSASFYGGDLELANHFVATENVERGASYYTLLISSGENDKAPVTVNRTDAGA